MKNICLTLALLLGAVPQFAQASDSQICISKPSEIARNPEIAEALAGFGGLSEFEGNWKMTGFLSVFAKAQVGLSHSRSGFAVEINKAYSKPFTICVSESRPDLITMNILNAENPDFAKLLLKPGRNGETLYVGAKKTSWKFVKFKRP